MKLGDRARCQKCGGRIVLVNHPGLNLNLGMWVHASALRRFVSIHPAVRS